MALQSTSVLIFHPCQEVMNLCDWRVMFLKACVSGPRFADLTLCKFFKMGSFQPSQYICEIYMKVSVLIETLRSHWQRVLLISDDISLAGSLISVPDRKAVLWRVRWSRSQNDYQLLSLFTEEIRRCPSHFLPVREHPLNHEVVDTLMCCVSGGKYVRRAFCLSPNKLVSEALDQWLECGCWCVYYVYCCTYSMWCLLQRLPCAFRDAEVSQKKHLCMRVCLYT